MITVLYLTSEKADPIGSAHSLANMIKSVEGFVNPIVIVRGDKARYFFESQGIVTYVIKYPTDITDKKGYNALIDFIPRLFRDVLCYLISLIKLCKLCRIYHVDVIHTNTSIVDIGCYLAKIVRKPQVWHLREFIDLDFHWKPFLGWNYLRRRIKRTNATISVSKTLESHFCMEGSLNSYQIYNAVRSRKEICYNTDKEKYFLMCGNISQAKGVDTAIKMFGLFNKDIKGYRLKLIGNVTSDYRKDLLEIARQYEVENLIDFEGYKENPKSYYQKASAFLMCSKHEAMGRVTVEAMFFGCPVIGYNSGGTKEIITNNYSGFLFNTEEEGAECMKRIITDPQKQKETIIENAHKVVADNFSVESYGEKILSIYRTLCKIR